MKRAIAIRHLAFEDMGCFAEVLAERDIASIYIDAPVDDIEAIDPETDDLLIVLGGPISVNDTDEFAFLGKELSLLQRRLHLDKPTLGICLGAQLMARALGAQVYPGQEKEIGWSPIKLTDAGQGSVLKYLSPGNVLHWHGETFDLPVGAVHLASSAKTVNQAFAYGKHTLALQYHAECTQSGLESWYVGHIGEIQQTPGLSVHALRAQAKQYAADTVLKAKRFFAAWLDEVTT